MLQHVTSIWLPTSALAGGTARQLGPAKKSLVGCAMKVQPYTIQLAVCPNALMRPHHPDPRAQDGHPDDLGVGVRASFTA